MKAEVGSEGTGRKTWRRRGGWQLLCLAPWVQVRLDRVSMSHAVCACQCHAGKILYRSAPVHLANLLILLSHVIHWDSFQYYNIIYLTQGAVAIDDQLLDAHGASSNLHQWDKSRWWCSHMAVRLRVGVAGV